MIGALVNVRRGARSPPLLTVTLVACILLFGFNYWVSSSRNVELQTKLLELEEAVRRAAAERAREQVGRTAAEEQESLLLNISSTAKTVQDMKNQMKSLREDLSKVQKELQSCQNNMNTLNKKLTYDMTQCNTQILAQKEECNEKVAAAKLEVQKKYEKQNAAAAAVQPGVDATQKAVVSKPVSEVLAGNDSAENAGKPLKREPAPGTKPKTDDHLETNEIPQDQAVLTANDSDKLELPSIPLLPKQNSTLNSLTNAMEGVMDIKGGDSKDADALLDAAAVANVKEEEDAIEYDNEGEIEKRLSKLKDDKAAAQEFDEELADYNGDDENEPEFEADKQAELAKV
ncbi:Golgi membrane protein 1 isoform X2 [Ictalurus furcatus]|uniref:Golgi membrane protein 1 isoform X2 n=1 Tax=Ictalurus furcatus TaxID=66913 RepID=UPI002350B58A|nr:Golgi membrane protein 1 isoform X2 [Ictalurus furcatus]